MRILLDDANAKYLKLSVTGTLGVLIKAKRQGHISELEPVIQEMIDKNIYISEKVMKICLEQVNEEMQLLAQNGSNNFHRAKEQM